MASTNTIPTVVRIVINALSNKNFSINISFVLTICANDKKQRQTLSLTLLSLSFIPDPPQKL